MSTGNVTQSARKRLGQLSDGYVNEDYYTPEANMGGADSIGLHILIDNTNLVGTLYVQISNDGGNNWVSMPWATQDPADSTASILVSGLAVTSGDDVNDFISGSNLPVDKVRCFFDWTSGEGLLSVYPRIIKGA